MKGDQNCLPKHLQSVIRPHNSTSILSMCFHIVIHINTPLFTSAIIQPTMYSFISPKDWNPTNEGEYHLVARSFLQDFNRLFQCFYLWFHFHRLRIRQVGPIVTTPIQRIAEMMKRTEKWKNTIERLNLSNKKGGWMTLSTSTTKGFPFYNWAEALFLFFQLTKPMNYSFLSNFIFLSITFL